jgi:hypothetical protein
MTLAEPRLTIPSLDALRALVGADWSGVNRVIYRRLGSDVALVNQVAHRHVGARSLGDLELLPALHDGDHLV